MRSDPKDAREDRALGELAHYYRSAEPFDGLTPAARARVRQRVRQTLAKPPASRARWQVAVVMISTTVGGGLVWAAVGPLRGILTPGSEPPTQTEAPQFRGSREPRRTLLPKRPPDDLASTAATPEVLAPAVRAPAGPSAALVSGASSPTRPGTASAGTVVPTRTRRHASLASVETAPAPLNTSPTPPSSTAVRSADGEVLLGEALRRLRNDRDPAAALRAIDEHAASHPRSALAEERATLRIEALLALGRAQEALAVLDTRALETMPRTTERFLLRAELRLRFGRPHEAASDFARVLELIGAESLSEIAERALWGRAASRLRSGDRAGAEEDLSIYQVRFPHGRFAAEVARLRGRAR